MVDYCIFTMLLTELGALHGGGWGRDWNGGGKMKMGKNFHTNIY